MDAKTAICVPIKKIMIERGANLKIAWIAMLTVFTCLGFVGHLKGHFNFNARPDRDHFFTRKTALIFALFLLVLVILFLAAVKAKIRRMEDEHRPITIADRNLWKKHSHIQDAQKSIWVVIFYFKLGTPVSVGS